MNIRFIKDDTNEGNDLMKILNNPKRANYKVIQIMPLNSYGHYRVVWELKNVQQAINTKPTDKPRTTDK